MYPPWSCRPATCCVKYKRLARGKDWPESSPTPTNTTSPSMPYCDICGDMCHCCCPAGPHYSIPQQEFVPTRGERPGKFNAMAIRFRNNGICGIPIQDGVAKNFRGLQDRDQKPFKDATDVSDQVTLRVQVSACSFVDVSYKPIKPFILHPSAQVTSLGLQL